MGVFGVVVPASQRRLGDALAGMRKGPSFTS